MFFQWALYGHCMGIVWALYGHWENPHEIAMCLLSVWTPLVQQCFVAMFAPHILFTRMCVQHVNASRRYLQIIAGQPTRVRHLGQRLRAAGLVLEGAC